MSLLEVSNLSVNYGHIQAVENASFNVELGEIVTLIGSNGAGKTTSLMAISGLATKLGGTVMFEGHDITDMTPHNIVKLGIAHVPEGRMIFPDLTVEENLRVGAYSLPKQHQKTFEELLSNVFELFPRLKERLKQFAGTLSGGEQQMLAIGRGMMMDPKIILLDEPSLGLAPIIVEEIFSLITKLRDEGKTILLVEQNASMALSIANRGYVMETGQVVLHDTGEALLANEMVKSVYLGG
ncbi:MAG: ABC transporter ATP-binding protein [Eubacteriales bacterium]|nr:ABC transporter ATP-binding protein [Eubacteriales bacterium]